MSIPKDARIYVAGHRGLVGNAIMNALHEQGYVHLIIFNAYLLISYQFTDYCLLITYEKT